MKRTTFALAAALLVLAATAAFHSWAAARAANQRAKLDYVYSVCNASRISPTITEYACGVAQDNTNTEFVCESNNRNPATHCWVEEK